MRVSLRDHWDGVRRSDVEDERTQLPAAILVILLGPQGGSPRRRRSGVNRHSSSCPVGTGNPLVALLVGVPSGDLSGRCGVLVVACAAAGSVMALLPPRIGIMRRHGRPPCGPRAVGSANRRPARQAPPGGSGGCVPARSFPPGWRPAAPCGSHVSRGCAGRRPTVAGSQLGAPRRHRAGPGRAGPQHQGHGGWRCSLRLRSGQQAPGHGHGPGLRPELALAAHARQRDDHDHGGDDNQNDQEHGPLLPTTPGTTGRIDG